MSFFLLTYFLNRPCVYCSALLLILFISSCYWSDQCFFDIHSNWFEPRHIPSTIPNPLAQAEGAPGAASFTGEEASFLVQTVNETAAALANAAMEEVKRRAQIKTEWTGVGMEWIRSWLGAREWRVPCLDVVKPVNYEISLYDLELGGDFNYKGLVKIELQVKRPTKKIVINAHQLKVEHVQLSSESAGSQEASDISYDEKSQRANFSFANEINASEKASLEVQFTGIMNNNMAGFYRSKYKPAVTPLKSVPTEGENHLMFSTQFESCDARTAFPCFDEPNLKASFDFSIEIPEDLVALSNMPETGTKESKKGFKLLAWAFGDLEHVEDFTRRKYNGKPMPVRVYTTRGLKDQARFGLKNAYQVVDYFSEV
ncbi:MAG: hypothetical protein LQ348_002323 [Seirophora lacunosa]|nr:MAG: hypothetical protein LQ348_002323 [Seirophora lacunosa]